MPLQKRKKKKKPASDKSVKQVVTQVVRVNIGDTKPKKRRKRKSSGGSAPSAAPPPMLAQVPQQFIYPPQSFPQEAPMAPPRQSAPSVEVADPFPVSALDRVLGSMPRSTIAVPQEVPRPTLMRPAEKPQLVMPTQPVMIPKPMPPPMKMSRNVEVVDAPKPFVPKPKLTGVDRVPIGARDIPESASVPKPRAAPLMRAEQKPTFGNAPKVVLAPDKEVSGVFVDDKHKAELALKGQKGKKKLQVVDYEALADPF
jgi:hypothetical protein